MENRVHRRIGDYEVLRRLGLGGMGEVLQVRHVLTGRIEAMKVLLPHFVGNRQRQERFLREIQTVAKLEHPNIARLCTAATHEDQIVMVMDYVDGVTVESMLEDKPLPVGKAVRYMVQALRALAYAHRQNIVHRDFKPANLMVTSDGTVKLMDFGIAFTEGARLTQNGSTLGTFYFMSPEQARGETVDGRSDLYSAGVTLYEMVTGRTPFLGTSPGTLMAKHVNEMPPPPSDFREDLPHALNDVVLKLLAKDPADRYQSADEAREALEAALPAAVFTPDEPQVERHTTVTETPVFKGAVTARPVTSDEIVGGPGPGIRKVEPDVPPPPPPRVWLWGGVTAAVLLVAGSTYVLMHRDAGKPKGGESAAAVPAIVQPTPVQPKPVLPTPVQPTSRLTREQARLQALGSSSNIPGKQAAFPNPGVATATPTRNGGSAPGEPGTVGRNVPTISPEQLAAENRIEMQLDTLDSQAIPLNGSVAAKQQEMERQGLRLRSEVIGQQLSMNNSRTKAREALQAHDVERADRYMAQAKLDVASLQTSLGLR